MYSIGDLVIYGNVGVCRVDQIATPEWDGVDKSRLYYYLTPLYKEGCVYTPVDGNVFMRPVISRRQAEQYIGMIPSIEAPAFHSRRTREVSEHYEASMQSHDCEELIKLLMSIDSKKRDMKQDGKLGLIDERFMKRAEDMLYGEFSVALDLPLEKVQGYIEKRVEQLKNESED